jgi:hypothetical protein
MGFQPKNSLRDFTEVIDLVLERFAKNIYYLFVFERLILQ